MFPHIDKYQEPTPRIKMMKERFLGYESNMCCQRAEIYTEVYKKYVNSPLVITRAIALKEVLKHIDIFIEDGELLVGHPAALPRSAEVFPEVSFHWISEIDDFPTRECNRLQVDDKVKNTLLQLYPFWEGKTLSDRFNVLRNDEAKRALSAGLLSNPHEWSTLAHVGLDVNKMLKKGVLGILEDISCIKKYIPETDPTYHDKMIFYRAIEIICQAIVEYAARYRELILKQIERETDSVRKDELTSMSNVLARVPLYPARSFHEALQSFWFVQLIAQIEGNGFSISAGRFDQYMIQYLEHDLEKGMTIENAIELLDCLWLKFCEILRVDDKKAAEVNAGYAAGQNLVVGGVNEEGKDATNILSYLCLIANKHVGLHQPNFTVRLHKNTSEEFYNETVSSIANGNGMPQVLNDEIIIPALLAKGFSLKEARDYIPVGCDEITVPKMWGRCNGGYLNFVKVLEISLNGGKDMLGDIPIGKPEPISSFTSFENLKASVYNRLQYAIALQVSEANLTDIIHRDLLPLPFISLFVDDCISKGCDVTAGGARYNTTGLVGVGSANFGDSLYAIKKLVYDDKEMSLSELRDILINDFESQEIVQQRIINRLPKYGNDIDEVDSYIVELTNRYFDELENYQNSRGGLIFPALYSVTAQVGLGSATAASADGRKKGLPLADGLTPMYGRDVSGPTAALKSITKIDLVRAPNGVIVNQRLSGSILSSRSGREKMKLLLKSFVNIGGFHWQFNIIDNKDLLEAQKHPENYRGLVVRVAGYSAIFVELSKKAQDSVIARNAAAL